LRIELTVVLKQGREDIDRKHEYRGPKLRFVFGMLLNSMKETSSGINKECYRFDHNSEGTH